MKLCVLVRGDWLAISCEEKQTVEWLAREILKHYCRKKGVEDPKSFLLGISRMRRARCGTELRPDDVVGTRLDENDIISVECDGDSNYSMERSLLSQDQFSLSQSSSEDERFLENDEVILDGQSLTCADLMRLDTGLCKIKLSEFAIASVNRARQVVEDIVQTNKVSYGINTGFGKFARTVIDKENLEKLQENLIRSHAAGVGDPLSPAQTRRLLALRINVLAKGYSGISLGTLNQYIDAFNASCLPFIPEKGTVGASGDLAPLAHLAAGLMGEGKMWSPDSGWGSAKEILESNGLQPLKLGPKEGLALINGTQLITALGVEGLQRADAICRQADVIAAMTIDVLKGSVKAFDSGIHMARPHTGQMKVAGRLRSLLHSDAFPSQISESHINCDRVQDPYSMRCCPQVHGIVNDTVDFVRGILSTEMNSATDNPMVFADRGEIISGGNFHGEYPAKALDYLTIAIHEIGSISERRLERLINPTCSELPAFLTNNGGLNSGFMMAHCTAAALVSENKVLCHPSSVDSIPTSAGTEDHVSMGGFSARKLLRVVENVEQVIAIELLAACQAMEFLRPLTTTKPLEAVYSLVRSVVQAWHEDRMMAPDLNMAAQLINEGKVWEAVRIYLEPESVR